MPMSAFRARNVHRLIGLAVLASCAAAPALAQTIRNVDRAVAGQTTILQRYAPPPQVGSVAIGVEDEREQIDMAKAERVRFRLNSLTVDGVITLSPGALAPLWQARIGSEISLAQLYRIADAVDAAYLRAGYFSKTVVPVQDFSDGRVRLQVFEGYVDRIEIDSAIPDIDNRLAPYIERILAMHPIRVKDAERELLLMSDLGGLEIEGTFVRPEGASGGGLLRLAVAQARTGGMIGLDNLGSNTVGPLQLATEANFNDALGLFESTSMTGVTTPQDLSQLGLLQFAQSYPIGSNGLTAGYNLVYLRQQPGGDDADLDIDVTSAMASAYLSYPFIRTLDRNLWGEIELTARNDDVDVLGNAISRSKTRWATASLQYDQELEKGSYGVEGGLNFGMASDIDMGDVPGDFRFLTAGLTFDHALGEETMFSLKADTQYSGRALPGAVQFALGGDPYGWAFDNGTLSGDSGAAITVGLTREFSTGLAALPAITPGIFADYGTVWYDAPGNGPGSESLASYGVGVRGVLGERLRFELIGAFPWQWSDSVEDPGNKFLFRLAVPI